MHILVIPVGSLGDVLPFLALGRGLQGRGHRVTVIGNGYFEQHVRKAGLELIESSTAAEYLAVLGSLDLSRPATAFRAFWKSIVPLSRRLYQAIESLYVPGETVVAAAPLALGARIAQDRLGVPVATLHVSPFGIRSVYPIPARPGEARRGWVPLFFKRFLFFLGDALLLDPLLAPAVNRVRAELHLPPARRLFNVWCQSPCRVIGLFPDWFGLPPPDWPSQTLLTGFPLYDAKETGELPADVSEFLAAGEPPLVFTAGTWVQHGRRFFKESVAACRRLGRRGILLTSFREQLPPELPEDVRVFDFLPFSRLLPRAAALVHHGGIGTLAQGFAAGIPQLVMPSCVDQFDHAARLKYLGAGDSIWTWSYSASAVARKVERLLSSPTVAARCRELAGRMQKDAWLDRTCEAIEELAERPQPAVA